MPVKPKTVGDAIAQIENLEEERVFDSTHILHSKPHALRARKRANKKRAIRELPILPFQRQELDDLLSCLTYTQRTYPRKGAKNFIADLKKIERKLWRIVRNKSA